MKKKRKPCYLPDQLEEFGLPVFQRIAQENDKEAIGGGHSAVIGLLVNVGKPFENGMPDQRQNEEMPVK